MSSEYSESLKRLILGRRLTLRKKRQSSAGDARWTCAQIATTARGLQEPRVSAVVPATIHRGLCNKGKPTEKDAVRGYELEPAWKAIEAGNDKG